MLGDRPISLVSLFGNLKIRDVEFYSFLVYIYVSTGSDMKNTYTAVVKKDDDWWIGWIEEIPGVNCQERKKDDLMETLKVTLKEALEFTH
jgi:hypothetical protein